MQPFRSHIGTIIISILVIMISLDLAKGDHDGVEMVKNDSFSFSIPNPFSKKPFLEANNRPDGRHFILHIPVLYDLEVLHRNGLLDSKQSITFLSGLTDYYRNRKRDAQDNLYGPIRFSILGLTLYDNKDPDFE